MYNQTKTKQKRHKILERLYWVVWNFKSFVLNVFCFVLFCICVVFVFFFFSQSMNAVVAFDK